MADKLIVNGLGKPYDGEYEFDLAAMMTMGDPDCLTNGEGHTIKRLAGVRAGEIEDSLAAGDNDVLLALGVIVLARQGKRLPEHLIWEAPMGSGIMIVPGEPDDAGEDDARPPAPSPTATEPTGSSEKLETSGGASSSPQSDSPAGNDRPPTGSQDSETPSGDQASDLETSQT